MSLFKPSNLTPNFESVVYNQPLTLTFQVNSNGSKVTAYRVQILKDINDNSDSEENIIGTIYGTFDTPLYNKDIGEILLTQETLSYNGINLEPNKDYRWRLRLYGENKRSSEERSFPICFYDDDRRERFIRINAIDFAKNFTIQTHIPSQVTDKVYLIISQEDLSGIFNNMRLMYGNSGYDNEDMFWNLIKKRCPKSFYLSSEEIDKKSDLFYKNKIHPCMYFYQIQVAYTSDDEVTVYYPQDCSISYLTVNCYQIQYQGYYDEDLTYIGNGMLVGSTKQIMWTPSYDEDMKRNSYARLTWTSGYGTDFQPFKFDTETIEISNQSEHSVTISRTDIKKEYLDNLTNGKYYILLSKDPKPFSSEDKSTYILEQNLLSGSVLKNLRKIVSVKSNYDTEEIDINISGNEDIPNYNTSGYEYLILCYVQQEKIIQVDKGVGSSSLTKILFEEPFDFNPMVITSPLAKVYGQNIHLGYVSDDFDYDRFYITPVEEFDNSDGFSYIYLFKNTTDAISDSKGVEQSVIDNLISSTNESKKMYKIINYVSSTGEVTIYNKVKFLPTIQTYYQVYKRVAADSGKYKYDLVAGMGLLGGQETNHSSLVCNNNVSLLDDEIPREQVYFDELFVQPNLRIKEDYYMPMCLKIYNKYLEQLVYLTNYYNWEDGVYCTEKYYNTKLIDNLDDTMWKVVTKNINSKDSTLIDNITTISENLYFPQTQYKIYSNFVDCVPDGFFYSRYDKSIKFEIYNLNTYDKNMPYNDIYTFADSTIYKTTYELIDDIWKEKTEDLGYIDCRDLYIKTICQDSYKDSDGNLVELNTNNVPLKEYHYEIMTEDGTIVYSTKETYDGKFCCEFRGCNNQSNYYIKVYIEDDFGKLYISQIKVPINYYELIDYTHITTTPLCEKQAIKINFASVKKVEGIGNTFFDNINANVNIYSSDNNIGLTYSKTNDNNILEIPQKFSYLTQFKLNPEILDTKKRNLLNQIVNDNSKGGIGDIYYLYLDTKPYFYKYNEESENNEYSINPTYMKFIITVNQELSEEEIILDNGQTIFVRDFADVLLTIPTQFAFIASTSLEINDRYIYIIPDSLLDIEESQRNVFKATVPTTCINGNDLLISNDVYLITNVESYIEKNKTALQNMNTQTFKIVKTDTTLNITIN